MTSSSGDIAADKCCGRDSREQISISGRSGQNRQDDWLVTGCAGRFHADDHRGVPAVRRQTGRSGGDPSELMEKSRSLRRRNHDTFISVSNHDEVSAPGTIEKPGTWSS